MRANGRRQVKTRFEAGERFEVPPVPAGLGRREMESAFQRLWRDLTKSVLEQEHDPARFRFLESASNEAASVSWATGFPLLVFPVLLEEKIRAAREHLDRQAAICVRSQETLATELGMLMRP